VARASHGDQEERRKHRGVPGVLMGTSQPAYPEKNRGGRGSPSQMESQSATVHGRRKGKGGGVAD